MFQHQVPAGLGILVTLSNRDAFSSATDKSYSKEEVKDVYPILYQSLLAQTV